MRLISLLAILCGPGAAWAHDYWLQPDSFFPAIEKGVAVRLHVGDKFQSEAERPLQLKPTLKFQLLGVKDTQDLLLKADDGRKPVVEVVVRKPGSYVVRMDRAPQHIKLAADKFNHYLAEEGLESILEARRRAGEDKKDGRERYGRCLKLLLQVGDKTDDTCKRVLGQTLEIVPQANPYALKPGDMLPVLVLFEGKPLAGVKLFAHSRAEEKVETQTAVTSREGTASFRLNRSGAWLLRCVHMRRCAGDAEADWESFWAALSFGRAPE